MFKNANVGKQFFKNLRIQDVQMFKNSNVEMWFSKNVRMSRCANVKRFKRWNAIFQECENVRMCKCLRIWMWIFNILRMWECQAPSVDCCDWRLPIYCGCNTNTSSWCSGVASLSAEKINKPDQTNSFSQAALSQKHTGSAHWLPSQTLWHSRVREVEWS